MNKKIFIILPYKESLDKKIAGAVSLYVKDTSNYSKYKKQIRIISSEKIKEKKFFKNKNYVLDFCNKYKDTRIDIIEIHNRPEYIPLIKKFFPNTKIIIFFHNDPLSMRNSEKINERQYIIDNTFKMIFISHWIQKRFYIGLKNINISKSSIIPHGVIKINSNKLKKKEKNILFVGKLNKSKGYHIFCKVALMFKKYNSKWNFISIGDESRKKIYPAKDSVNELGYLSNKKVLEYYQKSEIAIGNSVWNEPLGRIAIEASSRKCFPIISNIAGFSESKKIAKVLKHNTAKELFDLLKKITANKKFRKKKQDLFYKNNDFDVKILSKEIDFLRSEILNNKKRILISKNRKILHIANFNESSEGRLYYSFAKKLNNGFVKNNHNVEIISDRNFLRSNKFFLRPKLHIEKFNQKVINTLKNFSPDLLLIGHVFNLDKIIFDYCKKNNIKICSWFIDSLSKEFLKDDQNKKFNENLKYVDKCFVTSSPQIFKRRKHFNKLQFIPNPVDISVENLKNFENNSLDFDVFCAVSHGQNRVILKKGKVDVREKLITELNHDLPQIKFSLFGVDGFEPIWGANFYYYLAKSKMALNLSRGVYQKLYSSDRIASLIGNGLLVFIDEKTEFNKLFTKNELIFFKNKYDLMNKIKFYSSNDKIRSRIAKMAYKKYHKHMNNQIISNYILNCVNLIKSKNPYWHNLV